MLRTFIITGTDTGVGKTVLTAALVLHLRATGRPAVALKPLCSGGRGDARQIWTAQGRTPALDVINPWHFRAPLTPALAARLEGRRVTLAALLAHVRRARSRAGTTLVEGAGGLLSPLGKGFATRDLILPLRAGVIVVALNRLGVINHVRLTLEALPPAALNRTHVVLMNPTRPGPSARHNPALLRELLAPVPVLEFPWLKAGWMARPLPGPARRMLEALAAG